MALSAMSRISKIFEKSLLVTQNTIKFKIEPNCAKMTCFFSTMKALDETCKCAPVLTTIPALTAGQHPRYHIREYCKSHKSRKDKNFTSDSESDSDLETLGHRGESHFWRRKIRTFHSILDVNKDGVISYDDFRLLADRFVNLGHLSDKHTHEFRAVLKNMWEVRWGEPHPYNLVTVEQFLEDMHHVLNDKKLVRRAHSFLPYLFRAVNKDRSGEITEAEFKLFFECLGLAERDAILAFRTIDSNADGKLTRKEFVMHGRAFFLTEDEECISKYFFGPLCDH